MTLEDNHRQVERAVFYDIPSEQLADILLRYKGSLGRGLATFGLGEIPFDFLIQSLQAGEDFYRREALDLLNHFHYREGPLLRSLHQKEDVPFGYAVVDEHPRSMVNIFRRYEPDPRISSFAKSETLREEEVSCGIGVLDKECLRIGILFRGKLMVFLVLAEKESGNLWEIEDISRESDSSGLIDFESVFCWETFLGEILYQQFTLPGAQADNLLLPDGTYWKAPFDEDRATDFVEAGRMKHSAMFSGYVADRSRTKKDIHPFVLRA